MDLALIEMQIRDKMAEMEDNPGMSGTQPVSKPIVNLCTSLPIKKFALYNNLRI